MTAEFSYSNGRNVGRKYYLARNLNFVNEPPECAHICGLQSCGDGGSDNRADMGRDLGLGMVELQILISHQIILSANILPLLYKLGRFLSQLDPP